MCPGRIRDCDGSRSSKGSTARRSAGAWLAQVLGFDDGGPEAVEDAGALPALVGAVDGAVVGEDVGQLVPAAAGEHLVDDRVEGAARVDAPPTAGPHGRVVLVDDRLQALPELVADPVAVHRGVRGRAAAAAHL